MKTLKKSLCLILALVFVLSLCTLGAGAFSDDADIKYDDAVGIMAELGILEGPSGVDGPFNPKDVVTRAQAAKMIAYMILGKDNAERMPATGSFSDVKAGDWYAKYVGYCAKQGIINGKVDAEGNKYFDPDAPVTGTELAKMILCALGYGKADEYVGSGWDFNAVADALTNGIYDNSEAADFAVQATREECALYIFNALTTCDIVNYKDGGYDAGLVPQSFGAKVWKLVNKTGIVTGNKASGAKVTEVILDGDATATEFKFDTGLDVIGHEVRVLYKDGTTTVYNITDVSEVIPAFTTVGTLKKAAKVNKIANYVVAEDTAYAAPAANSMIFSDLIMYNDEIIGYVAAETFEIAQVTAIDDKTCKLDSGKEITLATMKDADGKAWTLVDAAKGDYIEVVAVGDTFITRATSKFENIKITQITNPSAFVTTYSYNNGQYVQSGASNVATYLDKAASKLTMDGKASYTFYKDSKGGFFRAEEYTAPAAETNTVFFITAFSVKGGDTVDEWGTKIEGKTANYAQCVTANGEMVNYETAELITSAMLERGPATLSFDSKGKAELAKAGTAEVYTLNKSADAKFATAASKIPGKPYYLTSDCNIIVLSAKKTEDGAAEKGNLKVTTIDALKGDFTESVIYVALPATTAAAKDIKTIWIDGAAKADDTAKPVADSYIYVTDDTQVGSFLTADGKKTLGTYNVYIDGVKTEIAMESKPSLGFFTYSVKDGVYTLSTDSATTEKLISLDGSVTLLYNGVFSASDAKLDGKDINGAKVVDLRLAAAMDPTKAVTDVAGLEKLTETVKLTVLMDSKDAFVGIFYVID